MTHTYLLTSPHLTGTQPGDREHGDDPLIRMHLRADVFRTCMMLHESSTSEIIGYLVDAHGQPGRDAICKPCRSRGS